jgi:hypothetical protein
VDLGPSGKDAGVGTVREHGLTPRTQHDDGQDRFLADLGPSGKDAGVGTVREHGLTPRTQHDDGQIRQVEVKIAW